ncbi:MAG: nucleoside-diphosphate kinase [Candidatus Komeilibacteria bacterium]|nr:nucleoside-diphosphate kinase [Candidatus Komeilibacteria bacterium]
MLQKTLVIIKPDAVMKDVATEIIDRYLAKGLTLLERKDLSMTLQRAKEFYSEHAGKFFFEGLVLAMTSWPVVALLLEGEEAVAMVRELNGATIPAEALPGTIRHDFRSAGGPFNTVHGSDSLVSAAREIALIFGMEQ